MIYFDHNATTYLSDISKASMLKDISLPYNASSLHSNGRKAKYILEESRRKILLSLLLDEDYDVIFTSGGTESNNLVIDNFSNMKVITSSIEHPSILEAVKNFEDCSYVRCNRNGLVDLENLESLLKESSYSNKDILVSIMHANNETGVIQPIDLIKNLCLKYGAKFHTDIIQTIGKIDLSSLSEIRPDFMTLSSHKVGGPLGVGCLVYKKSNNIRPIIIGGGQEKYKRSGTENIHSIRAFAEALEEVILNLRAYSRISRLRDRLEKALIIYPFCNIVGIESKRLPNTSNIIMSSVPSITQLINFDLHDIGVSSGSACSSGKVKKSHVLSNMGFSDHDASCSIRVSLGKNNNIEEIDKFVRVWKDIALQNIKNIG